MSEHLPARLLDARDQLVLHLERPHEPVEVGGDDHIGAPGLDGLNRATQPGAIRQWLSA
jgi:hypothetical protein